jgi:SAM-dependent methyltransferase
MESREQSLLARWMSEGVFKCPICQSVQLEFSTNAVRCRECAVTWPVRNQVPDFFNQYTPGSGKNSDVSRMDGQQAETIETLIHLLDLPDSDGVRASVADIVQRSSSLTCDNIALNAEINDLIERFVPPAENPALPAPAPQSNADARINYVRHYFSTNYPAGDALCANVRIQNLGSYPWSSRTAAPRTLSAWWGQGEIPQTLAGTCVLPVDLLPGACITLPVQLEAPRQAGQWTLFVGLADGGKLVADVAPLKIPLKVSPNWSLPWHRAVRRLQEQAVRCRRLVQKRRPFDYGEDHQLGVQIIKKWVQMSRRNGLRFLEVGSGTHPHTAWLPELEVLAVDISLPLLELGSLYFGSRFTERLGFVCADASNLPLASAQFDAIAMFSALHHFPQPDSLLRTLGSLLRPNGVIFVICEPVGKSLDDATTVRELARGINEQVFTLDEYRLIFERACLKPRLLRVDGCSLKAMLLPSHSG